MKLFFQLTHKREAALYTGIITAKVIPYKIMCRKLREQYETYMICKENEFFKRPTNFSCQNAHFESDDKNNVCYSTSLQSKFCKKTSLIDLINIDCTVHSHYC